MRVNINRKDFDKRQRALIREIAHSVKEVLEEAGLPEDQDLAEGLLFRLCAILDSSRVMEADGRPLLPFLTFADSQKPTELLAAESGSWMHEICADAVEEVFGSDPELAKVVARLDRLLANAPSATVGPAEPGASPNGGLAEQSGDSGASGRPPSVS